jgi:hypothetical protein
MSINKYEGIVITIACFFCLTFLGVEVLCWSTALFFWHWINSVTYVISVWMRPNLKYNNSIV